MALLNDILNQLEAKLTYGIHLAIVQASHYRLLQLYMEDRMLVCVVGRGREDIECSENVRNNITINRMCTSLREDPETGIGLILRQACIQWQLSVEGN